MQNRLVQLALEALESRKAAIDKEIAAIRAGARAGIDVLAGKKPRKKKRNLTAAARKALSKRMKAFWAARRKTMG